MTSETVVLLGIVILALATLYSSLGHAGASGYLAAMALLSIDPAVMKPTALCLNILVASIATVQFARASHFSWRLFWPLALGSIPAAFVGGVLTLPGDFYRPLVGVVLLAAAGRLLLSKPTATSGEVHRPSVPASLIFGGVIGLLAGLTGTGGGIFLTPLLLFMGWAPVRQASGVSAAFILVNSVAGLLGLVFRWSHLPPAIPYWAAAAVAGGIVGSYFGSRRLQGSTMRRLLALILFIAGLKLAFT